MVIEADCRDFLLHSSCTPCMSAAVVYGSQSAPDGGAEHCWARAQVSFAFNRIESALSYILNHLGEISGLAAEAERLDALLSGWCPLQAPMEMDRLAPVP